MNGFYCRMGWDTFFGSGESERHFTYLVKKSGDDVSTAIGRASKTSLEEVASEYAREVHGAEVGVASRHGADPLLSSWVCRSAGSRKSFEVWRGDMHVGDVEVQYFDETYVLY